MASHNRHTKTPIDQTFFTNSERFEFHALVKLLENLQEEGDALGEGIDPTKEPLRIQARVTQEFPSTEVHDLVNQTKGGQVPPLLITNFLGIAGNQGPLPDPYTDHIVKRNVRNDTALRDFLDIFNHRLLSIFHRIRKKFWIGVSVEKPENSLLGRCLKSLLGLANPSAQERLGIPDRSLTYYAGILWQKPRSGPGLEALLQNFFRTPAKVHQHQGHWTQVPSSQQTLLGKKHNRLGDSAFVGTKYWDQSAHFTATLGPMSLESYINFLKPGSAYKEIKNLIAYYAGHEQDFKLNLIVEKGQVPRARLSCGVALGWTSWLNRTTNKNKEADAQCILTTHPLQKIYQRL